MGTLNSWDGGSGDGLQGSTAQRGGSAERVLGKHRGQPVHRGGMRGDQPHSEVLDVRLLRGDCEGLDVPRAVEELVLESEVTEERLVERLRLLGQGLDGCRGSPEETGRSRRDGRQARGSPLRSTRRAHDRLRRSGPARGGRRRFGPVSPESRRSGSRYWSDQAAHAAARSRYSCWLSSCWFAPSALMDFRRGVHLPNAYPSNRWVIVSHCIVAQSHSRRHVGFSRGSRGMGQRCQLCRPSGIRNCRPLSAHYRRRCSSSSSLGRHAGS